MHHVAKVSEQDLFFTGIYIFCCCCTVLITFSKWWGLSMTLCSCLWFCLVISQFMDINHQHTMSCSIQYTFIRCSSYSDVQIGTYVARKLTIIELEKQIRSHVICTGTGQIFKRAMTKLQITATTYIIRTGIAICLYLLLYHYEAMANQHLRSTWLFLSQQPHHHQQQLLHGALPTSLGHVSDAQNMAQSRQHQHTQLPPHEDGRDALLYFGASTIVVSQPLNNSTTARMLQGMFQHDSFEPALSTCCLVAFIYLWGLVDCTLVMLRRMSTSSFSFLKLIGQRGSKWIESYQIQQNESDMSMWFHGSRLHQNLLWYFLPIATYDWFVPRRYLKLQVEAPTVSLVIVQVISSLIVYDALFFLAHFAMHRSRWLYRKLHAKHHHFHTVRACETVRLSFVEQIIDVAISIITLNLLGCHPVSRAIYDVCITYLLAELHCGYDMPWMAHNVVPFGIMSGPLEHDRHHATGINHYEKFFTFWDRAFGFIDDKTVSHRATAKKMS
jgi:sterol desaturase/sphingolipid hydroxylase (fatty acid hydroxylase superfamily)